MDSNKLYYLSHPYTTYGNPERNKINALIIENTLHEIHNLNIINPIVVMPALPDEEAMAKCRHLYDACDAIILCDGWEKSKGCNEEYRWALEDNKPIYIIEKPVRGNKLLYYIKEYKTA